MKIRTALRATTAAALIAAGGMASADTHAVHPETGEVLASTQEFTYRVLDEHSSVDPGLVEDVSGSDIVRDLFEGLLNQDESGNLVPGVALDYEVSEDGLTYTFNLRPEARWSNGDPVTAQDFVYAWRRAASPELASPYQWYMSLLALENVDEVIAGDKAPEELGVTALDERTLEVRLSQPLPYFPQMVVHSTTFPVHQPTVEEHGDAWTRPENIVSNGAYVLTEHVPQERSVRERNEMYWDNENTIIEKVTALVINDENQALTRYLAGELDRTQVPAGQYPRLKEEYPEQAVSFPELCSYYYMFNLRPEAPDWARDARVRKALSYAINRDVIVDNVLQGGQDAAYTFTPSATAGFEAPEIDYAQMTQQERVAEAKRLMEEAGYGPGNPLEVQILYNTSEAHKSVAIAVSQMWKQALGVETTLANQEWQTFLDARQSGDFEIARGGWCGDYNEASTFLDLMSSTSGYNDSKFVNEEVDEILAQAKTADDPLTNYQRVEEIIAEEMPIAPIYHYAAVYMLDEHLENWPVDNVQQNWYSKDLYFTAAPSD